MVRERVVASIVAFFFLSLQSVKRRDLDFWLFTLFLKGGNVISPMLFSRPELRDYKSEEEGEEL